jgi:F-type H+-transporting ATPase subunit delta
MATLREHFEATIGQAADRGQAGDALLAIADLLSGKASVRRALTDAGRDPESRETLARRLFGGRVDDAAVDVVAAAVRDRWSRPSDLVAAIAELGVQAHLAAAEANDRLKAVEDEVFRFGQLLGSTAGLRSALLNRAAPAESKSGLIRTLLDGKAHPETIRLVEYAAIERRQASLERQLDRITELAAARNQRRVAVVRVARPLSDQHRDRLQQALSAQAGGPVQLNVVVEPAVVGGIKVEIGDDVVDGTVQARLDEARRQLAVSH